MNHNGLIIALVVAALVGVTFGLHPELDLAVSRFFYQLPWWDLTRRGGLPGDQLRNLASILIALVAAVPVIALALKLVWPRMRLLVPGRAIVLLLATLALGPGLITNLILKDHWGRARPIDVVPFGGEEPFIAWWTPGDCYGNCSFVAGEPSGAFWTLAPAALVPAAWRPLACCA